MSESPVKAPQSPSITRTLEELPAHGCNSCGTTTTRQCDASHPNTLSIGGCPLFAFYCSDRCQEHDSKKHQEECEQLAARDKLFAIARTLSECWLTIRKNTWDYDVTKVSIEENGSDEKVVCEMGGGGKVAEGNVFHQFDERLVKELHTKYGEVRDAVLTAGTSEHAVACLFQLVEYLLQDLCTKIEEVRISPGVPLLIVKELDVNDPNSTSSPKEFNYNKSHWVYKITATTGIEYAIDITGAQYGDDCVLCPWELINVTYEHRTFGESHTHLHNVLNTNFASLELAYREISWTHLSCALDIFVKKLQEKKFQGPLRREDLVGALDKYLKDTLPVDPVEDFKEWVERHCDKPTPLAKMLGLIAPGSVPRGVEVQEDIPVQMAGVEEKPQEHGDAYERYQREGRVKWTIL